MESWRINIHGLLPGWSASDHDPWKGQGTAQDSRPFKGRTSRPRLVSLKLPADPQHPQHDVFGDHFYLRFYPKLNGKMYGRLIGVGPLETSSEASRSHSAVIGCPIFSAIAWNYLELLKGGLSWLHQPVACNSWCRILTAVANQKTTPGRALNLRATANIARFVRIRCAPALPRLKGPGQAQALCHLTGLGASLSMSPVRTIFGSLGGLWHEGLGM